MEGGGLVVDSRGARLVVSIWFGPLPVKLKI